jgi:hypothetical protein
MTIPRLVLRDKGTWQGYIRTDEIKDIGSATPLEQKLLQFSSILEQQVDLLLSFAQQSNHYMRQLEAAIIRARLQREADLEKEIGLRNFWKFATWFAVIAGGAAVAFLSKKWLGAWFP